MRGSHISLYRVILLAFVLWLLGVTKVWAEQFVVNHLRYSTTGTNTISCIGHEFSSDEAAGYLIIPGSVYYNGKYWTVTAVGGFSGYTRLTGVSMPNSVTSIGNYAFSGCTGFSGNLNLPTSLTSIGIESFWGCTGFTGTLTIPESVTNIDITAFAGTRFSTVYWNAVNCNDITCGYTYFYGYYIYNSTHYYGLLAACSNLKYVYVGSNVQRLPAYSLYGCSQVTTLASQAETPPAAGDYVFNGVNTSINVKVPCGKSSAYQSAQGWSVFSIVEGDECEYLITGLADPAYAGTVSGSGTYNNGASCTLTANPNAGYKFIVWTETGTQVSTEASYTFTARNDRLLVAHFQQQLYTINVSHFPSAGGSVTGGGTFTYGNSCTVTATPNSGFHFVNWTENGNSVSTDAEYTFTVTEARTLVANFSLNIYSVNATANPITGATIIGIGNYTHGTSCTLTVIANDSYTFINWTENGEQVSNDTEYSFVVTETRNLVANLIENIAFADPAVKSLCVANWDTNNDGELSYAEAAAVTDLGEVFRGNHDITSFDELQYFTGLTVIADNAFRYSISLSSITLPNMITTIGSYAFYQCYDLLSIVIPSSVTMIEDEVFGFTQNLAHIAVDPNNAVYDSRNDCNAIINSTTNALLVGCYNTTIPNTVTTIERYAFRGCDNLTFIEIPNSVTTIESETFYGCSSLTSITIPSSVTEIGSHVFAGNNLAQIVVELGNTHYDSRENCNAIINSETNALIVGCKNTIIPNTVTKIASSAFYACDGLTSIVIPQNVTELSYLAFYCCMNLDSITLNCVVPPTVGENAFGEVDKSIPIYVPCNTSAAYASASGWNEFTNIQEILCVNIEATANPTIAGIVTGGGNYYKGVECTLNAVANEGYMFESWTENGVFVSDNPEYTFTVNEDRTLEANFISTQTTQLSSGWNWWSTYIEMDGFNGLEYLENTVGDLGICIKSQVCAVVNYFPATGESFWFGDDIVIDNENCYMIDVTDDCLVQLDGDKADPADHPIRIKPNWSWIGYIDNVTQSANTAMSDFEPIQEDVIKSKDDAATYWAGYGWYPAINLVPGQGYKYFSNSNEDRYLVYNNASSKSEMAKRQEKFWHYDTHSYANTMTVISVVDINNEEVAKGNYELAAFVDNECRGSVKLDYFEPLDRYFAVMSIAGNDMEEISFGLADTSNGDVGFNCEQSMTFATDAVVGRLSSPYIISFNHENTDVVVNIYPNPVDKNVSFTLDIPSGETISEILIVNSLGAEVLHQTGMTGKVVKGLPVSGIYSIQVITNTGNVYRGKLVVK